MAPDGAQPVDEFIESLPVKVQVAPDNQIGRLNDLTHAAPHLPFSHSSQDPEPSRLRQHLFVNIPHPGVDVEWMSGGKLSDDHVREGHGLRVEDPHPR